MTENEFNKILDLYNDLKEVESHESLIIQETGLNNEQLFNSVERGVRQYQGESEGNNLRLGNVVDKIYYEHQDEIREVILNILRKELDKIVIQKKHLKLQFENIEVIRNEEERTQEVKR